VTIQSLAWAFDQHIPGNAKRVLLALANRACHRTGRIDFDAEAISTESCVSARSLSRYFGALKRNGYIADEENKQIEGGKAYGLKFERADMPWSWGAEPVDEEFESVVTAEDVKGILGPPPRNFSRDKQIEQRRTVATPVHASRPPEQKFPIIEGSRAYDAWLAHYRRIRTPAPYLRWIKTDDGSDARGFYEPSLFPPRQERIDDVEGVA
jgi:hypothetical protein